ncbi:MULTISPECIES: hypothetical protein [unclassified Acidovorax]|uniref:hypothetical protein n=1 Tax=unclassified Acidovorax TaxID=2684926 RepID=UPI000B3F8DBD|nr:MULTISPECIES: hypothetical protein [unclassified Acidovorax]
MFDLLTNQESAHAAALGWNLCPVYDMDKARWALEALPTDHPASSAVAAQARIYNLALSGDAVAVKTLQLIVRSHQPAPPAKKARKK